MKKIELTESVTKKLEGFINHNDPIRFVVEKLIKEKLEYDRDVYKAHHLLESYFDFKHIRERDDLPYEILKLCEEGLSYCYDELCRILDVDKLD